MSSYDPSRLDPVPFFSEEEKAELNALAAEYPLSELIERPRVLEERSIDYAYVSSKIEGSTYSKKGVSTLLKYGWTEGGKPLSDALMVLDINSTFIFIINNAQDQDAASKAFIKDIHANTTAHQLRPHEQGLVRKNPVSIAGSDYKPLESPLQLDAELNYLVDVLKTIADPFEQAAYVHCNLAYLQYFADGNKRTARLMQTAMLVHGGITPVFMRAEEIDNYLNAVIRYYEEGDRRSYAELFLRSYRYTIDSLLGRLPEQLQAIAEDEKRLQEAWKKRKERRGRQA